MKKRLAFRGVNLLSIFILVALLGSAILLPTKSAFAASQDFYVQSGSPSEEGMIMSLTATAGVVEPSTTTQDPKLIVGVIAPPDDTQLDIKPGQINVRTDGTAEALVSTLNGNVSIGDKISPSSIVGIGQKFSGVGGFVGIAQTGLTPKSSGAIKTTIKDDKGNNITIYVATIPVLVKVGYVNASGTNGGSTSNAVPTSIQTAADTIAGKHATLTALILSFLLALISIIFGGLVINSAIRGGLLAIARQPLTKRVIGKNVLRAFGMAAAIMIFGVLGAFLLLRIL